MRIVKPSPEVRKEDGEKARPLFPTGLPEKLPRPAGKRANMSTLLYKKIQESIPKNSVNTKAVMISKHYNKSPSGTQSASHYNKLYMRAIFKTFSRQAWNSAQSGLANAGVVEMTRFEIG